MVMPKSYDDLLERLMKNREAQGKALSKSQHKRISAQMGEDMHKITQMTPEETAQEVAKTTEGAFLVPPRKRGRPRGSRNKPKELK